VGLTAAPAAAGGKAAKAAAAAAGGSTLLVRTAGSPAVKAASPDASSSSGNGGAVNAAEAPHAVTLQLPQGGAWELSPAAPVLFRAAGMKRDPSSGVLVSVLLPTASAAAAAAAAGSRRKGGAAQAASPPAGMVLGEWDAASGAFIRSVALKGYGSEAGEDDLPQAERFAIAQVRACAWCWLPG
jgi:hypothetical protein